MINKENIPAEFNKNNQQTLSSMKYGKIDKVYLTKLLMQHKADQENFGKGYPVSEDLAICIDIIIKKTLGSQRWRSYTEDWREEMFGRATYLALKYCHYFNWDKLNEKSKNKDPYYYIGYIATRACQQKLKDLKKVSKYIKFTELNEDLLSSCTSIDQYAGVFKREEEKREDELNANAGIENSFDSFN